MKGYILNQTGEGPEVAVKISANVEACLPARCRYCDSEFDIGWTLGEDYAVAYCVKGHDIVVDLPEAEVAEVQKAAKEAAADAAHHAATGE